MPLSILTLYNYVHTENFEKQIHLIFLVEGLPEMVLDEVNMILKAGTMDRQYHLTKQIHMFEPNFGSESIEIVSLRERELAIEEKVENIMALDIGLIKFVATVPGLIEKNSFKLPTNVDSDYLIGEYMSIKEKQVMHKISKALDLYNKVDFSVETHMVKKHETVIFDNDNYTERKPENIQCDHEYELLINFINLFFSNNKTRNLLLPDEFELPTELLLIGIDIRQVLYSMASMYSPNDEMNRNLRDFFRGNSEIDNEEEERAPKKRRNALYRSLRESYNYSHKILILLLFFMVKEEAGETNFVDYIAEIRNQLILTLGRMLEHLISYIQFKSRDENYKIKFSRMPLSKFPSDDMPLSKVFNSIQYALNFLPFIVDN